MKKTYLRQIIQEEIKEVMDAFGSLGAVDWGDPVASRQRRGEVKVGDILTMVDKNSPVYGQKGKVIRIYDSKEGVEVDFGSGNKYGIINRRIKGNKINESVNEGGFHYFKGKMLKDLDLGGKMGGKFDIPKKSDMPKVTFKKGEKVELEIQPNSYHLYGSNGKHGYIDKNKLRDIDKYVFYESINEAVDKQKYDALFDDSGIGGMEFIPDEDDMVDLSNSSSLIGRMGDRTWDETEEKTPVLVDVWYSYHEEHGYGGVYKVKVHFDDKSVETFDRLKDAEAKYDLEGVEREETEFDVS